MNEYDIFVPLFYNDGRAIEMEKFFHLQASLVARFGGLTVFPQPIKGFWRMGTVTYHDEIVVHRVIAPNDQETRRFLTNLKQELKAELQQEDILIIVRDVTTL